MRRTALAAGILALVANVPSAGAVPSPATVARAGRLAGTTTISWAGNSAISLDVSRRALLQDADADLVVHGGSYAFVRIVGNPTSTCDPAIGPYCLATSLTFLRGLHDPPISGTHARSHWTVTPDPAAIDKPRVGVYLFTDGRATLTLRSNLPGRTSYVAAGRFRGQAIRLPQACMPSPCGTSAHSSNAVTYGGATYDLGVRGGWAEMVGVASNADRTRSENQLHGIGGCLFPNPSDPTLSADPADHQYGCDPVPANASQAYPTAIGEVNGSPSFGNARAAMLYWTAARGRQYIGYRAKSAGALAARVDAYGIWFNLGIR